MARKLNIAASLKRQTDMLATVVPIPDRLASGSASANSATAYPPSNLILRFPAPGKKPQEIDLSCLADLPNLRDPLLYAFRKWNANAGQASRLTNLSLLKSGFVAFLVERGRTQASLSDIDGALLADFIRWLDRCKAETGGNLTIGTRRKRLSTFSMLIENLMAGGPWVDAALQVFQAIPQRNWPGHSLKSEPNKYLDREHYERIIAAAEKEILELHAMLEETDALIEQGQHVLRSNAASGVKAFHKDLPVCLATLDRLPGLLPSSEQLKVENKPLYLAVERVFGRQRLLRRLHPSARELAPFAILLAVATAFNPTTILRLEKRNIVFDSRLGKPVLRFHGVKGRAAVDPIVPVGVGDLSLKQIDLGAMVRLLERYTARIRPRLPVEHRDRVFVFVPLKNSEGCRALLPYDDSHSDTAWKYALRSFCEDNSLEQFALEQIRPARSDEEQQRTGDIRSAAALLRHQSDRTTWHHYTSPRMRSGYKQRLGEVFMLRERWRETDGRIDPRSRASAEDHGAATPGFTCLDPFSSPLPSQRVGRLCKAYGECPSCPLALANIGEPISVATYHGLQDSIIRSRDEMDEKAWAERWLPVLLDLRALLRNVPPQIQEASGRYTIQLPLVG